MFRKEWDGLYLLHYENTILIEAEQMISYVSFTNHN